MKHTEEKSVAYERVMDTAERLFARKGYNAVTLRDIASEIGIHHTTVYHHVPGGKEQLYIDVVERNLGHHRQGLTQAIASAPLTFVHNCVQLLIGCCPNLRWI